MIRITYKGFQKLDFSMVVIIIGSVLIVWAYVAIAPYLAARHWHVIEGRILEFQVEEFKRPEVNVVLDYLLPHTRYEYVVDGEIFNSNSISFDRANIEAPAEKHAFYWKEWNRGSTVKVFVNPNDPADAVLLPMLSRERSHHYLTVALTGVLLVIVGACFEVYL